MRYINIILIFIALIMGGYLVANFIGTKTNDAINLEKAEPKIENNKKPTWGALETQINEEGQVSIAIMPLNILDERTQIWNFEVTIDTHSAELSEDMAKTAFLIDSKGNKYLPIIWEGSEPGGHHREGILKFKKVLPKSLSVKLIIAGVGGIKERVFQWNLE